MFEVDGYNTLITKAALHGAKLLKKPHQATAVHAASHLWWQEAVLEEARVTRGARARRAAKTRTGTSRSPLVRTVFWDPH